MKFLLSFTLLVAFSQSGWSQCLTVKEIRGLFGRDSLTTRYFLQRKGFTLRKGLQDRGDRWVSKQEGSFSIDRDVHGQVWAVNYGLPLRCFRAAKREVIVLGLEAEAHHAGKKAVVSFYSKANYGVIFHQVAVSQTTYYTLYVLRKQEYKTEQKRLQNRTY
jgi:hypothetical protein